MGETQPPKDRLVKEFEVQRLKCGSLDTINETKIHKYEVQLVKNEGGGNKIEDPRRRLNVLPTDHLSRVRSVC